MHFRDVSAISVRDKHSDVSGLQHCIPLAAYMKIWFRVHCVVVTNNAVLM